MEVASNLQKVRGYVNDGTRILNGITLNRYSDLGNELRVISFWHAPEGAYFLCLYYNLALYVLACYNMSISIREAHYEQTDLSYRCE